MILLGYDIAMKITISTLLFLLSFPLWATIQLSHLKGTVLVEGKKALLGQKLKESDTITTKKSSLALIKVKSDQSVQIFKISENSQVTILKLTPKHNELELKTGSLFVKFLRKTKAANQKLDIKTKSVVMGVRGTHFFIAHSTVKNHLDDVWMCVQEGTVVVTDPKNKETPVKAGQGVSITQGKKVTPPKSYPWTKKLNWNMEPKKGKLENLIKLDSAYQDLLDQDYD